jgi:hypothetical protein
LSRPRDLDMFYSLNSNMALVIFAEVHRKLVFCNSA